MVVLMLIVAMFKHAEVMKVRLVEMVEKVNQTRLPSLVAVVSS